MTLPLAILLDFDGTVVDSESVGIDALNHASAEVLGEPFAPEIYQQYLGRSEVIFFNHVAKLVGELDAERIRKAYHAAYAPLLAKIPPLPGVLEWLPKLAAIAPMVVVSGSRADQIAGYFALHGVEGSLHSIICCDDYQRGKPDPQPFEIALARLAVMPRQALVIEDSDAGVEAGLAAGCRVLGLRAGNPAGRYCLAQADLVLEAFTDLTPKALRELCG